MGGIASKIGAASAIMKRPNENCFYIKGVDKQACLLDLFDNFISRAVVTQINSATPFGNVSGNWREEQTTEMREFFKQAMEPNSPSMIRVYVWENHIKTGKTHVSVTILGSKEQDDMVRGCKNVPGKCMRIENIIPEYSQDIFRDLIWFGSWYDGALCGSIKAQ